MKKIIFRADGNNASGLGHLYRIFALIEILKGDFECVLLTSENSTRKVIPEEYKTSFIPSAISTQDEAGWLSEKYPSGDYWIVVDGYHFNSAYQQQLKKLNYTLIYIDDLATEHMFADLVINHSPSAKRQNYMAEAYTKFALGTEYALVRPMFIEAAGTTHEIKKLETAFVCFGGSDQFDFTTFICRILLRNNSVKKINVVIGEAFKSEEILKSQKINPKISIFKNLSELDLLNIMQQSHFAIVPTSTILFEACSIKMPVLSGYYMDNQKEAYFSFLKEGAISGLGNFKDLTETETEHLIVSLLNKDNSEMLKTQSRLFDGKQKERFIKILNNL